MLESRNLKQETLNGITEVFLKYDESADSHDTRHLHKGLSTLKDATTDARI